MLKKYQTEVTFLTEPTKSLPSSTERVNIAR